MSVQVRPEYAQAKQKLIEANILFSFILLVLLGWYLMHQQTRFFKNIIDAENEIVLLTNGKKLLDGNRQLQRYFPQLETRKNKCICDFFLDRPGYITKIYQNKIWVDYLLEHPNTTHKALILINEQEVTLQLKASVFDPKNHLYVVVASDITDLEGLNRRLLLQNRTDELTRAGNRRYFNKQLQSTIHTAQTASQPLSLIMFDIDFFKNVNDTYGHSFGDWVLKKISNISFEVLEHQEVFYRIGGEEFAIILVNTDLHSGAQIAEQLRKTVAAASFNELNQLTISLGVVELQANETTDQIMRRVDKQLYAAKQAGRNQVSY